MPGPFGFTNAFTSGELDDNAWDRTDLQQVAKGCALGQNLIVQIAGPLAKRAGFWWVSDWYPAAPHRLLAFRKGWDDSLLLMLGAGTCAVWNPDGTPLIDQSVGGQVVFATPFTAAQLPLLRWKQVQDVIYFRTSDGMQPLTLARTNFGVTAADWTFTTTNFKNGPWLAENTDISKYITLQNTTGSGDITDGNDTTGSGSIPVGTPVNIQTYRGWPLFTPAMVGSQMRIRANQNSQSCEAWAPAYPYWLHDFVTSNGNMYYSLTDGGGSSVKSGNNPPVQLQGTQSDGTILWGFLHDGAGVVSLETYVSPTEMQGHVLRATPVQSGNPTFSWAFAAYSPLDGWPSAWPEIREERLVDGATSGNQDWVDLTETAGFDPTSEDFTPGTGLGVITDANAVRRRVGTKGGKIQWFRTATYLLVGTETGEHLISGPVLDEPISPSGVVIKDLSEFGCAPLEPANVQTGLMYVTITEKTLREILVSTNQEPSYEDHSFLAQHIANRNFAAIKWTKSPLNNLWCLLGDGGLACYTYHAEQQVKGWTSQLLGGGLTVLDMQVMPSPGGYETLWILAEGANGNVLMRQSDIPEQLFMDVATSWTGAATNVLPAPTFLDEMTVDVLADGAWYAGLNAYGGQVILPAGVTVTSARIGLTYPVFFRSLKLDLKNLWGGALLQTQRITEALIDLLCAFCTIGGDNVAWPGEDVSSRLAGDIAGIVPRRFVKRVTIAQDESAETDDHDPRITISEQTPYAFTLYAIRQDKVAIGE